MSEPAPTTRPSPSGKTRRPQPYDHPAVSRALFTPSSGATLPRTQRERGVDIPLSGDRVVGGLFASRVPQGPVLCVFHGGQETISETVSIWPRFAEEAGANLLQIDYPGSGASPGTASLSACRQAARATLQWLFDRPSDEVPAVIVLGRGIGAPLAIDAAVSVGDSRLRGLILESGIADLSEVVGRAVDWSGESPPRDLTLGALRRDWDPRETLTQWKGPLLVLQPSLSPPFPFAYGEQLAQWGGGDLVVLDRGDRDDVPRLNESDYIRALRSFVETHGSTEEGDVRSTGRHFATGG